MRLTYTIHPMGWVLRRRVLWQILRGRPVALPSGIITGDNPVTLTWGTGGGGNGMVECRYTTGGNGRGYATDGHTIIAGGGQGVTDGSGYTTGGPDAAEPGR